jgi:hypothetical protein
VRLQGLIVHHDQDAVFTGYVWTARLLLKDHVRVSYALRGARDNTEMESFNSRGWTITATCEGIRPSGTERRRHSSRLCGHGRSATIPKAQDCTRIGVHRRVPRLLMPPQIALYGAAPRLVPKGGRS